jgi:hypothetical protein
MPTCFVIQPFDGGPFDKRYEDTLSPAIKAAGVEPYRVDRDASSVIPIEDIEQGIRKADVCLAEISTNNPNVWFEVGYAIASGKPVVLVCSHEREKFPFDVQHRAIIRYKTEAVSDFSLLADKVTRRLRAAIEKRNELSRIEELSPIANTEGLSAHEMVALVVVAQCLNPPISAWQVMTEMNQAGHTDIAVALALRSLVRGKFCDVETLNNGGEDFSAYSATEAGFRWLEKNQSKLLMRKEAKKVVLAPADPADDIPF